MLDDEPLVRSGDPAYYFKNCKIFKKKCIFYNIIKIIRFSKKMINLINEIDA